jgi:hypothetical protein
MSPAEQPINEEPNDTYIAKGAVQSNDGTPLKGVVVRAFDQDVTSEDLLGEATING